MENAVEPQNRIRAPFTRANTKFETTTLFVALRTFPPPSNLPLYKLAIPILKVISCFVSETSGCDESASTDGWAFGGRRVLSHDIDGFKLRKVVSHHGHNMVPVNAENSSMHSHHSHRHRLCERRIADDERRWGCRWAGEFIFCYSRNQVICCA